MTRPEIRESFLQDRTALHLNDISGGINRLQELMGNLPHKSIQISEMEFLEYTRGDQLANGAQIKFYEEIGSERYFRICATVMNPQVDLIEPDSKDLMNLFSYPPGSRDRGWNMLMPGLEIQAIGDGIQMGNTDYGLIKLYENGHMEFTHKINRHFCWKQSDQEYEIRPRLYPYPVIEFPTTFLKLWWAILTKFSPEEEFVINLQYRNIKGTILRPYAPESTGFNYSDPDPTPYESNHIKLPQLRFNLESEPDLIAFELTRRVYRKYGLSATEIPFFDKEKKIFNFGDQ